MTVRWLLAHGLALAMVGCGDPDARMDAAGDESGDTDDDGATRLPDDSDDAPEPPATEPLDVPESLEVVQATTRCTAVGPGERLASISAEGHAWLLTEDDEAATVRVVDTFDDGPDATFTIGLREIGAVHAFSADDAALVADGGLWRLHDLDRIEVTAPAPLSGAAAMCGDPTTDGLLLTASDLFQRRDDQWWSFPLGHAGALPSAVVGHDSACSGTDETVWMTAQDGTVWRLQGDEFERPVRFDALVGAAATDGMLGVLDDEFLWIGSDSPDAGAEASWSWQPWRFPNALPTDLSASDGALWMWSGPDLLRLNAQGFLRVEHAAPTTFTQITAGAGGAWLSGAGELCHLALSPMLRVEGIRPFQRSRLAETEFSVASADDATVLAFIDDEPLPLTADPDGSTFHGVLALPTVGWHRLRVQSDANERSIAVKRLPPEEIGWNADIRPLVLAYCSGDTCHGGQDVDAPRALDTLEAWTDLAPAIDNRVVAAQNMPPPGLSDTWGDDQIDVIAQWLDGERLP
ncbi:MAG: hypothetical protein AAF721_37535 [Myxococcota bacterium]